MLDRIKDILKAEFSNQFDQIFKQGDKLEDFELEELLKKFTGKTYQEEEEAEPKQQYQQHSYSEQRQANDGLSKEKEYYGYLELPMGAPFEDVKKAYRKLMKVYHPDLYGSDPEKHKMAEEVSQKLNEAYVYFEKKFGKS